jgi:signal transduction histidine kinase
MVFVRSWLLPILLAAAQVAAWPGLAWWLGPQPDRGSVAVGLVATALAAVALGPRRRSPLASLVAVTVVVTVAQLSLPRDATLDIIGIGEPIALYSVTARRSLHLSLAAMPILAVNDAVLSIIREGFARGRLGDALGNTVILALVLALGRSRYRWRAARQDAAGQLAQAEADRRSAAAAERQRLARELHDVAAHHLTSIVVTAAAAERLSQQPDLVTQALTFAANTGRETLAALHRLVAVMDTDAADTPPLLSRVAELASGFERLGQPVVVRTDGDVEPVPAAVAEAAHGIVREALTNALRYAPGAAVTVRLADRPGALEVTVDNDSGPAAEPARPGPARLGSGRGLTGMRERAEAVGGSVSAGPRPAGGWSVRATLPARTSMARHASADPEPARSGWWRRLRHEQVLDAGIALAAVVLPLAFAISAVDEDPSGVTVVGATPLALMMLLLVAHGLPLLWRRQAPWRVLAAVTLANGFWPVAVALKLLSPMVTVIAPGAFAACVAVYSVAVSARPDWATWISIPVAVLAIAVSEISGFAMDGSLAGEPATVGSVVFLGIGMAVCVGPEILAVWGAGLAVRLRRGRTLDREHGALAVASARAAYAARTERSRIAGGLRDCVLDLANSMTATADAGRQALADGSPAAARERLTETAAQARAALAAMRELLEMLRSDHLPADRSPQPTAAGIEQLCEAQRSSGRPVVLHMAGARSRLPAEVDVSAYRIVAAALGAGDRGPAEVSVRYSLDDLRISVTGVPAATVGPIAVGLRERVAAFGGRIALSRDDGTVDVLLPARIEEVTPSPSEEVTPSPSEEVTPSPSA